MGAASRFFTSNTHPKPVVVVNGHDEFLRQTVIRTVQARRLLVRCVTVAAPVHPAPALAALAYGDLLVYAGCDRQTPPLLDATLRPYLDAPLPHTALLLTDERPGVPSPRHFAGHPNVQQIDLPKTVTQAALVSIVKGCGIPTAEADALVTRLRTDPERVFAALDRLRTLARPWTTTQVRTLSPKTPDRAAWLDPFDVLPGDAYSICTQLGQRFQQLASLAAFLPLRLEPNECCRRAGVARVQYVHLAALARGTSPQLWLRRVRYAIAAATLVHRGFADADLWLKAMCGL